MSVPDAPGFSARGVLSADSSVAVERLQIDAWRRMSPLHKARTVDGLTRTAQALALAGIRHRHPGASERECFLRLAVLKLGGEATMRLYPDAAALHGRSGFAGVSLIDLRASAEGNERQVASQYPVVRKTQ